MLFLYSLLLVGLALTPVASASGPHRHARRHPQSHSLRALPRHGQRFTRRANGQATVKCLSRYTFSLCDGSRCTDMGSVAEGTACVDDSIVMDSATPISQATSANADSDSSSSTSIPAEFQPSAVASAGKVARVTTTLRDTNTKAASPSVTSSPLPDDNNVGEDDGEDGEDDTECEDESDADEGDDTGDATSAQASPSTSQQYITSQTSSKQGTSVKANVQYTKPSSRPSSSRVPTITTTTTKQTTAAPPTTTSSSSSPSPTSSASSGGSNSGSSFVGKATYYYQEGGTGACGHTLPDSAFIVAMNVAQYGGVGASSQYCGKTVQITNTDNGKSVTCVVQDACPGCAADSLDLSVAAFEAIGALSTGVLNIKWSVTD